MVCPRCQGLMVAVRMNEQSGVGTADGWRCLLCGEAIDSHIQANRAERCQPAKSRARVPGSTAVKYWKGRG